MHAEKLFSVYFNTTDAELHMQEPSTRKRMRKSKKAPAKKELTESESEDEGQFADAIFFFDEFVLSVHIFRFQVYDRLRK